MPLYAATITLGALLLFLVQPLLSRAILPWFGGSAAVWTTSLAFFQTALLLGYALVHLGLARLKPRAQVLAVFALLAACVPFLPIAPDPAARPTHADPRGSDVLRVLVATVLLPYVVLACTGPLVQSWFAREFPQRSPYRLFALSNAGSALGLIAFPFALEPWLGQTAQIRVWSIAFVGYGVLLALTAWRARKFDAPTVEPSSTLVAARPRASDVVFWLGCSAFPALLLIGTTERLTREVAAMPFLWILPLLLYLVSFIVAFDVEGAYHRFSFGVGLALASCLAVFSLRAATDVGLLEQCIALGGAQFVASTTCHGELSRARPATRHLTLFYLVLASGGALGGLFGALIAPQVFDRYVELPIGLVGCVVFTLIGWWRAADSPLRLGKPVALWLPLGVGLLALAWALRSRVVAVDEVVRARVRDFFGVLTVVEDDGKFGPFRMLVNGSINHGTQYTGETVRRTATSYFAERSGADVAIRAHARREQGPLRIGIVGLGTGTIAAWAKPGDAVTFFEISPAVVSIAREWFTYLDDCAGDVAIELGDARLSLEAMRAAGKREAFDVLVIDAFSSDAIPMHLLTREAVALYLDVLPEDGVLAVHVSNRFLDLVPIVHTLAQDAGCHAVLVQREAPKTEAIHEASKWVLLTRDESFTQQPYVQRWSRPLPELTNPILWTDEHASLWDAVRAR
ncbi:MAG: fused MFS/spermidine synthase [Planctomycetes bacterium]|nr:fused MFS/spermidine synthase [Planctomycetota bacterium]